jgi:hypothetical protein
LAGYVPKSREYTIVDGFQDAEKAYSAVHTAALRKAHEARKASAPDEIMKEAYFLEAYAQHFLTDLFSSGHLRTPRRRLHKNSLLHLYPVDQCQTNARRGLCEWTVGSQ